MMLKPARTTVLPLPVTSQAKPKSRPKGPGIQLVHRTHPALVEPFLLGTEIDIAERLFTS